MLGQASTAKMKAVNFAVHDRHFAAAQIASATWAAGPAGRCRGSTAGLSSQIVRIQVETGGRSQRSHPE